MSTITREKRVALLEQEVLALKTRSSRLRTAAESQGISARRLRRAATRRDTWNRSEGMHAAGKQIVKGAGADTNG